MNFLIKMVEEIINKIDLMNRIIEWFSPMIYFLVRVVIATAVALVFMENNLEMNRLFQFVIMFWVYYPVYHTYFNKIFWVWRKE